ncbi:PadR family transcriptional regulator [Undibacterium sp. Rencai35W]|uniref:PadR family transcriptional regulator n=1 Tax=Undibacterium sp. Rencai35W TaxID=3413046 RepID=UPI003BF1FBC4
MKLFDSLRAHHARHHERHSEHHHSGRHHHDGHRDHHHYFAGHGDDTYDDEPGGGRMRGGGHGRGRGERAERVFGRGDLPLIVLALIEISPRHGYEIIKAIEERCGGAYAPSPGAIYPTLTLLEEQDQVTSSENAATSGKRLYTITTVGRDYLEANRAQVDGIMARLDMFARVQAKQSLPERVHQAMHTLKHALMLRRGSWNAAEADRVAAILEQAAHQIIDEG